MAQAEFSILLILQGKRLMLPLLSRFNTQTHTNICARTHADRHTHTHSHPQSAAAPSSPPCACGEGSCQTSAPSASALFLPQFNPAEAVTTLPPLPPPVRTGPARHRPPTPSQGQCAHICDESTHTHATSGARTPRCVPRGSPTPD